VAIVLSLALAATIAEVSLRLVGRRSLFTLPQQVMASLRGGPPAIRYPDPLFHNGLLPKSSGWQTAYFGPYLIRTNSLGMRDAESRDVPLVAGKRRVMVMGDSSIEGLGLNWQDTAVGMLAESRHDLDILNAGICGHTTSSYLVRTRYMIESMGVHIDDLIVEVDISDPADLEFRYANFDGHRVTARNGGPRITGELLGDWTYDDALWDQYGRRRLAECLNHMTALKSLCDKHGIRLHVGTHPWPYQIKANDFDSRARRAWATWCDDNAVPFIDAWPAFFNHLDPNSLFIPGDVHWSAAGGQIMANLFSEAIGKQ